MTMMMMMMMADLKAISYFNNALIALLYRCCLLPSIIKMLN